MDLICRKSCGPASFTAPAIRKAPSSNTWVITICISSSMTEASQNLAPIHEKVRARQFCRTHSGLLPGNYSGPRKLDHDFESNPW